MSEVTLKHIKKVYPNMESKKRKKKGQTEKKHNLQVTEEGVLAVQDFHWNEENNPLWGFSGDFSCFSDEGKQGGFESEKL